jgi:hypothetical protein
MSVRIRWAQGGEAQLLSISGEAVAIRSSISSPPGSRIEGTLVEEPPATLTLKVRTCRRQPSGEFVLQGTLVNVTREVRDRLVLQAGD